MNLKIGMMVWIETKEKEEIRGYIKEIKTKQKNNDRIKVILTDGSEGIVISIPDKEEIKREQFKYVNEFLYSKTKYSYYNNLDRKYCIFGNEGSNNRYVFIFSDKELGEEYLKKKNINLKGLTINKLNPNKLTYENFKTLEFDYFIIDGFLRFKYDDFVSRENHFKNLLKQTPNKK